MVPRLSAALGAAALTAIASPLDAQRGVTGRAVSLEPALGPIAWFAAGEFVAGADAIAVRYAETLCVRDLRARAAALGLDPRLARVAELYQLRLRACTGEQFVGDVCGPSLFLREEGARVTWLPRFGIDRREVTVAEYHRCVTVGGCPSPLHPMGTPTYGEPTLPVTGVTWSAARAYCAWRGARLPTEAEWERAARGREARNFPWGEQYDPGRFNHGALTSECRDDDDGYAFAAPVGSFPSGATPEGVLDLAGNAQEWVEDQRSVHLAVLPFDPPPTPGVTAEGRRVARGGAWDHPGWMGRATARVLLLPDTRQPNLGFRCAWDP